MLNLSKRVLFCIVFVLSMVGVAGSALYIASTRVYQEAVALPDSTVLKEVLNRCTSGAGYYNEGYITLAIAAIAAAALVSIVIVLNAPTPSSSSSRRY